MPAALDHLSGGFASGIGRPPLPVVGPPEHPPLILFDGDPVKRAALRCPRAGQGHVQKGVPVESNEEGREDAARVGPLPNS